MGLAASQARFLAITARKANCEFQSMQIAQEKLSISRELDKITTEYQDSLNATKLVWDTDGTGENSFNLNYDLMMKPSVANNYTPYLITSRDGRVVLDSAMAAAARQAGIPEGGCLDKTVTLPNGQVTTLYNQLYGEFINQMVKNGGMSESSAVAVRTVGLIDEVGVGAPLLDKTTASQMGINDLIAYMDLTVEDAQYGSAAQKKLAGALTYQYGTTKVWNDQTLQWENKNQIDLDFQTSLSDKGDQNTNYFVIDGKKVDGNDVEFTMSDLLTGDVVFARTGPKNPSGFKKFLARVVEFCAVGTIGMLIDMLTGNNFYDALKGLLGANGGELEDMSDEDKAMVNFVGSIANGVKELLGVSSSSSEQEQQAFAYALQQTLGLLGDVKDLGSRNHSTDAFDDAVEQSKNYNGWVTKAASKGKNYGTTAINLSNLTESFLTYYAQGINGYDETYYINQSSSKSSYVTDDPYYLWNVGNPEATTAQEMYIAEFYSSMFNNICQNGWVENDQIDDEEYLKNTLKNATYFISSLSSDNYYYQDRYLDNGYVVEVKDEDAIKEAEVAYTQAKNKLNYKEEELDLDMQKLDLEIFSLTTEYDTVKNLINNNIEKTFTMFN